MQGEIIYCIMILRVTLLVTVVVVAVVSAVQHFEEVPKDTNVTRGHTAVLKCAIGERKGAVQWTKDGFSLGFNRTIPGYDRYSVISSNENEFNLMIVNAHPEDDAVYECQVLPAAGEDRLQAKATLTVLVPCEPPVIIGFNNGSIVEVPFTQRTQELECVARNGRPAATIEWFRNGVKIRDNIVYKTEPNSDDKRETASSTLSVSLANHQEENGAVYRCEAKNSAVFGPPLTTSITMSLLFPPGPPEISGYSDGRIVNINDTLVLTCSSRGGNPLGTVTWYRNSEPVDWSFTSGGTRAINEYTFRVTAADNNAVYRCQVTNLVATEPLTAQYTLTVHFPPTSVKISGAREPVRADRTITLTCESSNSNPQATITWFTRSRQLPRSEINETYLPSPEGGFITRSQVRTTISAQDHNSIFTCQASNPQVGQPVADTLTLSVLYPPNPPEITANSGPMKAGDLERMTCTSLGGNPVAELKWYKGDKFIKEAVYKSLGNVASSEIAFLAKADDNGALYKCKASNKATPTPLEDSVRLSVNFPPSKVTITTSPSQSKAGQYTDLTCMSSSSNPAAEIIWVRNGRRMPGVDLGTVDAEYGGKNTTNRLRILISSKDHSAVFGCRATNRLLDQSVNDAVTLDVLFMPEFDNTTLSERIDVKKGDSKSINLTAYANPADVTYEIYKAGTALTLPSRFKMIGGILNISNVRKEDRGSYMVKATNSQGFATFNFTLNVKYPAEIVDITNRLSLDKGETAMFVCRVDANPYPSDIVTWSRDDFDMSRTRVRTEGNASYLSVSDLKKEDSGSFKCVADNRMGPPDTKIAKLIVRFSPVIDKSPEISRSAGEIGSTVSLKCNAKGAPDVSIVWTRNNNPINSDNKYTITAGESKLIQYESVLLVKDLKVEDYGAYICTASNSKGSDSHSITLTGTSKPNPPYNIEFVNATSNSITLSWKPGFDGGLAQSFRVRYKPVDARGYVYVDVRPFGATTFRIKGLELGTEYELTVLAFNDRGESAYQPRGIVAKTSDVLSPADISTSELQGTDEIPVIIILVVCIVGVFILTLNVGLILFFIRRRKKRMEGASETNSHTNTFELYSNTNKGEHTLYPAPSDDTRSYGTYDKSMDDFSDDYIRDYDRDCETHVFLPSQPDYPGSRPFSPNKIESPMIGTGHKMTYILDDHPGRLSPWNEEAYRIIHPRHKKGVYENGVPNGDIYEFKTRGKGMNELSDHTSSRPSSRSGSSTLLSPNIVANPTYNGPSANTINHRTPSPHIHQSSLHNTVPVGAEHRGHLV